MVGRAGGWKLKEIENLMKKERLVVIIYFYYCYILMIKLIVIKKILENIIE